MIVNYSQTKYLSTAEKMNEKTDGFCTENLIFSRLFAENGPLVQVDKVWPLLGFNSRDTFNRAALARRIPLHIIRPLGRRKSFVATMELSKYLASLSNTSKGERTP